MTKVARNRLFTRIIPLLSLLNGFCVRRCKMQRYDFQLLFEHMVHPKGLKK